MIDLIILYAISAGLFTFGKQAVINTSPFFLSATRLIPSGLLFLAWAYFIEKKSNDKLTQNSLLLLIANILITSLIDGIRFVSLEDIPSAYGALISALAPFIAAFIAYFFFKEVFPPKKILALFLGFFGVLPLIIENISRTTTVQGSLIHLLIGYSTMFLSVLGYVISTFIFKKLIENGYSVVFLLGASTFFGGITSLVISLVTEPWSPVPLTNGPVVIPIIIFLLVTHGLIGQPLGAYLIKKYPVTLVAFASLMTPVTSALFEYFFYKEPIGYTFVFSLIVLGIAFYLFYGEEVQQKAITR
jgi:drug/metabolite transporter (DMT)-like permease